ncbi:DUF418 domain-containing protein [Pseudactinotalea sp. Z1739]|uniref:DUF418 domain-containing protein n=1 Tax=Pseudactinotalea sp. Z1739 TaxID=3413028 RepID=UPI003C7CCF11
MSRTPRTSIPAPRGPVSSGERALAPDLARGAMLLLIALANVPWFLYGSTQGTTTMHPVEGSGLDRAVQAVMIVAVDGRIYPLFAFLFGYGIVQLYRRQREAGADDGAARRLLRRRHLWMIAFGFLHAALLWVGDVVSAYGLAGLVLVALFFRRRDRTLIVWAAVITGLLALTAVVSLISLPFVPTDMAAEETFGAEFYGMGVAVSAESNYVTSVLMRAAGWPVTLLTQAFVNVVVPVMILLALWAARRGILENPGAHLPLLRRTAVIGLGVAFGGGIPHALYHVGALQVGDHVSWIFGSVEMLTNVFGGLGYVALFTLIAYRIQNRPVASSLPVVAVAAVGKRSLSNYLGQSVLLAPVLTAWGLGLGATIGSAAAAGLAIATWAVLAALAYLWERRQYRGPAETLLRRLVYR